MRMGKIASSAEYRMDEQFQNCQFLEQNFDFLNWRKSRNFLIFQFGQFQKLEIWKNRKIFNLENSKDLKFGKLKKKLNLEIFKNLYF